MIIAETAAEARKRLMLEAIAEARVTHRPSDVRRALDLIAEHKQLRRKAWEAIHLLAEANRMRRAA